MSLAVEVRDHVLCGQKWVAFRARTFEVSWLKPEEAVALGHHLLERYGPRYPSAIQVYTGPRKHGWGST